MIASKSFLIKIGIFVLFFILSVGIGLFSLSRNTIDKKVSCISSVELHSYKKCGYIRGYTNKDLNKVVGRVEDKKMIGKDAVITLLTQNSKGESILLPIYVYSDPIPKNVTFIYPFDKTKSRPLAAETKPIATSQALLGSVNTNEEIIVNLYIPSNEVIDQAKNMYGNLKEFRCQRYQRLAVDYMINSTTYNLINLRIHKLFSGCNIYTLHIEKTNK